VLQNLNNRLSNQTLLVVSHEPEVIHQYINFNKAIVFTNRGAFLYTNQDVNQIATYSTFTKKQMGQENSSQPTEMETDQNLQIRVRKLLQANE